MGVTDFLFSLHKLLAWLFAMLTVLLPQHLLAPLSPADTAVTVHAPAAQFCAQASAPPRKLDRVALAPPAAKKSGASASASEDLYPATPASQTSDEVRSAQ